MAYNSLITASNGNRSNGLVLPSKRKAIDHVAHHPDEEEEKGGIVNNIRKEIKHVVKDYIDLKLRVKDFLDKNQVTSPPFDATIGSPYPEIPQIPHTYYTFHLGHGGLPEWKREYAIAAAKKYHALQKSNFLGYQVNYHLDYQSHFAYYLDSHVSMSFGLSNHLC